MRAGTRKKVRVKHHVPCPFCPPGSCNEKNCTSCEGGGTIMRMVGSQNMITESSCVDCNGTGKIYLPSNCCACKGTRRVKTKRTLYVTIAPQVKPGEMILIELPTEDIFLKVVLKRKNNLSKLSKMRQDFKNLTV